MKSSTLSNIVIKNIHLKKLFLKSNLNFKKLWTSTVPADIWTQRVNSIPRFINDWGHPQLHGSV